MRRKRKTSPGRKEEARRLATRDAQAPTAGTDENQANSLMRRQTVPRRKRVVRRPEVPDAKYKSKNVARFTSKLMLDGKRSLAERIIYDAFDSIEAKQKRPPLEVFDQALKNVTPNIEVKPRRV